MNKVVTSALAIGAGVAAFSMMRNNNMMSNRQMKKIGRRISRMF
ncbi:YrzQ family protein [Bacillus sp. T3]|nr:YrzQ family protein [Bacillus sp. T3]